MKALSTKQATQVASVFKSSLQPTRNARRLGSRVQCGGSRSWLDLVQADLVMANLFEPSQKTEALFENEKGQYTWKAVPPKKAKKTHASK